MADQNIAGGATAPDGAPDRTSGREPGAAEVDRTLCPLCGNLNLCLLAGRCGADPVGRDFDCWCAAVEVPASILEQLSPSSRGISCICRACITNIAVEQSQSTTKAGEVHE